MSQYILRRLLTATICVFGICVVVFFVTRVIPGDPAVLLGGDNQSPEYLDAIRARYGLDTPVITQFGHYLAGLVTGDLGTSVRTNQPITAEIAQRIPATAELILAALFFAALIALPLGILAAVNQGTWTDKIIRAASMISSSLASFWIGLVLIYLITYQLGWLPSPTGRLPRGFEPPPRVTGMYTIDALLAGDLPTAGAAAEMLMLPALTIGILAAGFITKLVRSEMVQTLDSGYVRMSRSLHISRPRILFQDGLRNAAPPIVTAFGLLIGNLIGGSVLVETIFAWPGLGRYASDALASNDLAALQGFVLCAGVAVVLISLALDVIYALLDPRIRLTGVQS
jgi:peptide/nickel transport system permease protein